MASTAAADGVWAPDHDEMRVGAKLIGRRVVKGVCVAAPPVHSTWGVCDTDGTHVGTSRDETSHLVPGWGCHGPGQG